LSGIEYITLNRTDMDKKKKKKKKERLKKALNLLCNAK
jgi:hypothetical protein